MTVVVGGVVIDALGGVAAAGVQRDLIFAVLQLTAAALLLHSAKQVKELADACSLRVLAAGVHAHKGGANEAGLGGKVARQSQSAKAAAVILQMQARRKGAFRRAGRKGTEIVQVEHLQREGRIIRQHTYGVLINVQPVGGGFHRDGSRAVCNQPMQLCQRQHVAVRNIDHAHAAEERPRFRQRGALPQQPRNQLVLRNVVLAADLRLISGVADEVQPRNAETLFVDRVIVQRHVVRDIGHADDGVMAVHRRQLAEGEGVIAGRDGHFVSVGKFIVQIASKVKIACAVGGGSTHWQFPPDSWHDSHA